MSDDLVNRLLRPWDTERSIMSQTAAWMTERQQAAERISSLDGKLATANARIRELEAENAVLREARGGRVKPLVWRNGGFDHDADLIDATETYQIQEGTFWYGAQIHGTRCADNETAKAAAQASLDALLKAEREAGRVEGLREAAKWSCSIPTGVPEHYAQAVIDMNEHWKDAILALIEKEAGHE